jgi:hypothetical protein
MCSFFITNKKIENFAHINRANIFYGNKLTKFEKNGFTFVSNSTNNDEDFLVQENIYLIVTGEIFNYKKNEIINLYKKHNNFLEKLDGEFSLVLIDFNKNTIVASSDIFGTKQLYFGIEKNFLCISTLYTTIESLNIKNISRIYENSFLKLNIDTFSFSVDTVYNFENKQIYKTYTHWEAALENSIKKRAKNKNITLMLSDGIDSGAISCCLKKYNINHNIISIITDEKFKNDIFYWRHGIETKTSHNFKISSPSGYSKILFLKDIKKYNYDILFDRKYSRYNQRECYFEQEDLRNNLGSDIAYTVCSIMREWKSDYLITGLGAIFSDNNINKNFESTNNIRGCNYDNPIAAASLCMPLGIIPTFPLLDKDLFQETLNLDKTFFKEYKSQAQLYLDKNKYPYYFKSENQEKIINIRGLINE